MADQEVIDELGLRAGQNISETQFWKITELNACNFITKLKLRELEGLPVPDYSELEGTLDRISKWHR